MNKNHLHSYSHSLTKHNALLKIDHVNCNSNKNNKTKSKPTFRTIFISSIYRHSGTSLTIDHNITNIPDVALNQSRIDNSAITIIEPSHAASILQTTAVPPLLPPPPRNGINRGLGFLRNTLFGHGHGGADGSNGGSNGSGSGGVCDSKDYKLLNHSINSQPEQYIQRIK